MAASISYDLVQLARRSNTNVYLFSRYGCPYIPDLNVALVSGLNNLDHKCITHNRKVERIIKEFQIDQVIYFQLGADRYIGENIPDHLNKTKFLQSRILRDLAKLEIDTAKVIVVGPTPTINISRHSRFDYLLGDRIRYSEPNFDITNHYKDESESLNLTYIDSFNFLCKFGSCPYRVPGGWLLQDDHHFSVAGSRLFVSVFEKYFRSRDS